MKIDPIEPLLPAPPLPARQEPLATTAARFAVVGLFAIALLATMKAADDLLLPIAIALVLTFVMAPAVRWLRHRYGMPEVLGSALLVATLLIGSGMLVAGLAQPASSWLSRAPTAIAQLVDKLDRLRRSIPVVAPTPDPNPQGPPTLPRASPRPAPPASAASGPTAPDPIHEKIASEGLALTRAALSGFASFAVSAAATVILLYFLLASEHWLLSRTVEAIPRRRTRAIVLAGVRCTEREISRYLGTLSLINIGVGTLTGLAVGALGLPNPVLWGVIAAMLNFIPYIGPIIMVCLLLLAGELSFGSIGAAVAPAGAFFCVHAVEANFVTPMLVGRHLMLSPLAVFLSVLFWGWLWGFAGALIAVPLLIGLRGVCKRVRRLRLLRVYLEGGGPVEPPSLRSLLRERRRRRRGGTTAV